ncbi:Citrate transporter [Caldalkalibacillus thermarum TA2.A1]|uniref:Citrate transporter n=1 Tax=Caldalkalibacillus thermarum (strain TA2.A1) TaxID=986075 RepID=F5L8K2_CALTT|nr:SLC13 family permease [Caldalkalibacillus thermarum]EGL82341.1 Citrate transporter [Caldalkalibacillus thermarum TA2.A1]
MTIDMLITYGILLLAVTLFVTEKLRTDLVAILIMVLLPWTGVITASEAFSGFSSNAVVSVIAVMLIGYGVERSGMMSVVADFIMKRVGKKEKNVMAATSATVGIISSFMQNIGAAALFLPALRKIGKKANIPASKIVMPMGFAAILGGTLTMVASGPLIILNDLLAESGHDPLHLFSVTPIGMALLGAGILYFYFLGDWVLPRAKGRKERSINEDIRQTYALPEEIYEIDITEDSLVVGKSIEELDIWSAYSLNILALSEEGSHVYSPWRKTRLKVNQTIAVLGSKANVTAFVNDHRLSLKDDLDIFSNLENEDHAGFAEIVVPPKSQAAGKKLADIGFRKIYNLEPVAFISREGQQTQWPEVTLEPGMQMIVFGRWEDIAHLQSSRDFAILSEVKPPESEPKAGKKKHALFSIATALGLVLLSFPLALSFFTGALLMILLGVIPKEEIYRAIDWKTVFLLAGLIPLGIAFENSGAAAFTASAIINVFGGWGPMAILFVIGIITMLFSLFMSNVAATVLLVPLVMMMADSFGLDPTGLALLVAVSASNSFLLPTHQVNAFLMNPGGYRNADYLRAGGVMSIIFLVVSVMMVYLFYI